MLRLNDLRETQGSSFHPSHIMIHSGAVALSNEQLMKIAFGPKVASTLRDIEAHNEGRHLSTLSPLELAAYPGIGLKTALRIAAILEYANRLKRPPNYDPAGAVRNPQAIVDIVGPGMQYLDQEEVHILSLDLKSRPIKVTKLYRGTQNCSHIRVAEIFKEPVRIAASAIAMVHNHPTGEPTPSPEDVSVTHMIVSAGKLLDIDVIDHIIIGGGTGDRWISMKQRNLGGL